MGAVRRRGRGRLARSRPSLTARGIAHARAAVDRPSTPDGETGAARALALDLGRPLPAQRREGFVAYVRGRTRFFDQQVLDALQPPRQVVIVGAGYDDRALRFRSPGVRFIEVDHPATQADKRGRLDRLGWDTTGTTFVAADLEVDDVAARLGAELDPAVPTLLLCESVLPYLTRRSGQRLLASLGRAAGPTGQLAADLPVVPTRWRGRLTLLGFRLFAAAVGEPVRHVVAGADVAGYLEAAGWREEERTTGADLGMPPSRAEWLFVCATTGSPPAP